MSKQESIAKMLQALDAYKKDKSSAKPFFTSMKEISAWLEKKAE